MKIGFIGLGKMGGPMAKNLLRSGFPLVVLDIAEHAVEELCALGAERGATPRDVAARCGTVITSLPSDKEVEAVVLGPDGVAAGLAPGSTLIDTSRIRPSVPSEPVSRRETS